MIFSKHGWVFKLIPGREIDSTLDTQSLFNFGQFNKTALISSTDKSFVLINLNQGDGDTSNPNSLDNLVESRM